MSTILDIYIALRERHLYVVGKECIVYTFLDVALYIYLAQYIYPTEQLDVDTAVAKLGEYCLYGFLGVETGMTKTIDGLLYLAAGIIDVAAITYSEDYHRERKTMVAGEILVVLGEELTVLECNNRTVGGFDKGAGIADGRHFSSYAVTFDEVANLDTARHQ